jgi:hypothetical protein
MFNVHLGQIKKLFNGSDLIIPSKMNRQHGWRKKKIHRGERLLFRRWESYLH